VSETAGGFALSARPDGRLAASGALTFATARAARLAGLAALSSGSGALEIDCAALAAADSAGLAVLIDWLAAARLAQRPLRFAALPESLRALARISEVDELLKSGV